MTLRTLHVVSRLDNRMGGSVHAALQVCRELVVASHEVTIIGTAGDGDDLSHLTSDFSSVHALTFPRCWPEHYSNSFKLRSWVNKNVSSFDLVDLHGVFSFPALYASAACRRIGVPYVVRPHGSLDPFDLTKHAALKAVYGPLVLKKLIEGAAAILTTTTQESDRLVTFGAETKERISLPLPVQPVEPSTVDFRARWNIPKDATVVLFLSRIDHKKGLQFLLPALAQLKAEQPSLWFVLAGAGSKNDEAKITADLDAHQMSEWTTRCGFVAGDMKAAAFQATDVFCLPSLNENFGIALVEALSAGLPVVISDEVYIWRDVQRHGAGLICKPSTESCLLQLTKLLKQPAEMREMGVRARKLAATVYSPEVATSDLLLHYSRLCLLAQDAKSEPIPVTE